MNRIRIAVSSASFSKNNILRSLLLNQFQDVAFNSGLKLLYGSQLCRFLNDADGALVGSEKINQEILLACPRLKAISKYGVGLDNIDLEACERRKISVLSRPGVNASAVAEQTLGLILMLCRNLFSTACQLKKGIWQKDGGRVLSGKVVGVVGLGHVGRELVRLLQPFQCRILANDIIPQSDYCRENGVEEVGLDRLLVDSDVVTLHAPLTGKTFHMLNDRTISLMKSSGFLVNTARGNVVDHTALKNALQRNVIAGAALDVFEIEPFQDMELLKLPNLIVTPHIAGNAEEAVIATGKAAIENLVQFFSKHQSLSQRL